MSRRFAHMLAIALIGAMLAPTLSDSRTLASPAHTVVEDPCGEFCICVPESSCGCIEAAPIAPEPAPQAPAPNQSRTQWHFPLPPSVEVHTRDAPTASSVQTNPTQRIVGGFLMVGRVNDALALISVWRT